MTTCHENAAPCSSSHTCACDPHTGIAPGAKIAFYDCESEQDHRDGTLSIPLDPGYQYEVMYRHVSPMGGWACDCSLYKRWGLDMAAVLPW